MLLDAAELVRAISHLDQRRRYRYVYEATTTVVEIHDIVEPEGPIYIVRYNPNRGESRTSANPAELNIFLIMKPAIAFRNIICY